jgi:predicted nuclease of predicted toxin-antitoxin system
VKLLLDNCVWKKSREDLAAAGHDVVHIGDWPEDPGDEELLRRAYSEGRVLVTLDKVFIEGDKTAGARDAEDRRLLKTFPEWTRTMQAFAAT